MRSADRHCCGHHSGHKSNNCDFEGKCHFRFKIPCHPMEDGDTPSNGGGGAGRVHHLYLASDEPVANGQFIGLGTASADFARNTVVIPENATITGMVFNIRDNALAAGVTATAEIVVSKTCAFGTPMSTGVRASVIGPNAAATPNCCGTTTANYPVARCDLLSVRIGTGGGAFDSGVAVTILYTVP